MKPIEKAKEILDKYKVFAHCEWDSKTGWDEDTKTENAKQCALIAVNEILPIAGNVSPDAFTYWNQVKNEINKL